MKTKELDSIVERELAQREAKSSFKGYHGFPGNLCVSINIVSLDFGAVYNEWQGSCALTLGLVKPEIFRRLFSFMWKTEVFVMREYTGHDIGMRL